MGCYNAAIVNASADKAWKKPNNSYDLSLSTNAVDDSVRIFT